MPRKKRSSSPLDLYDDDFDEDASSQSSQPPVQRNAANARERMRMRVLSSAYGRLKTKLPNIPPDTKLSKLDTLRLATLYIKQLINAVETGNGNGSSHPQPHANPIVDMLDTRNPTTDCNSSVAVGTTSFNFHNAGHLGMSWPFEFHQHLQHGTNRNSNLTFNSTRMDWQSSHTQSYPKAPRNDHQIVSDTSYTQLQDAHWYPAEMGMQLDQSRSGNGCCAYETAGVGQHQHQRGIPIATSQAHSL
ncbi:uncharacterized protein LOC117784385 [Drosophila innubila]|uniref:uncharacterized protein LOC117784385 n=1 Tax=Drosophila innubila TaxID=198719 RepID=UPI00148CEB66|nr:uncharacterized protein LOC117784385 [Drosophila innubila]